VIVAVGVAILLWSGGLTGERRAIVRMDPVERRALYDETHRNAVALCSQARSEDALRDRCVESASFLLEFPECDEACHAFARAHERGPTR
jgi:hypothetical protein